MFGLREVCLGVLHALRMIDGTQCSAFEAASFVHQLYCRLVGCHVACIHMRHMTMHYISCNICNMCRLLGLEHGSVLIAINHGVFTHVVVAVCL
jgi:hypothetical protein